MQLRSIMAFLCFGVLATPALAQLSALEVMQQVDARDDGNSAEGNYTLVLIDRRGRERSRNFRLYRKDYGEDSKGLSLFESPPDIRGTAYLNFDWDDTGRDDDSWLYLPALQRVKRIASSDTSDPFMGSDFTYADINGYELDWYDYSFVSESVDVDGQDTWQIEFVPKPEYRERAEEATGYSRQQLWVRKDNFVPVRGQYWETRGNRIKYYSVNELAQVEGIWTLNRIQAVTTRNGNQEHASVLQLNGIDYNVELADELFTTERMQQGLN